MRMINSMLSWVEHEKKVFINFEATYLFLIVKLESTAPQNQD